MIKLISFTVLMILLLIVSLYCIFNSFKGDYLGCVVFGGAFGILLVDYKEVIQEYKNKSSQ